MMLVLAVDFFHEGESDKKLVKFQTLSLIINWETAWCYSLPAFKIARIIICQIFDSSIQIEIICRVREVITAGSVSKYRYLIQC